MITDKDDQQSFQELMLENQKLLTENNQLLKKIHRASLWAFWLKVVWLFIIIGAPFVLYYFVVEPYFTTLGSSFQTFQAGLQEIPGWKQFYQAIAGSEGGK